MKYQIDQIFKLGRRSVSSFLSRRVSQLDHSLRSLLFFGLMLLLSACIVSPSTQQSLTIGILSLSPIHAPLIAGFQSGLADAGYHDGENVQFIHKGPVGEIDKLDAAGVALAGANPDLIFSVTTPATQAAKSATGTVQTPIIFSRVTDPVGAGFVEDLTTPGSNITGVLVSGALAKKLEWFQMVVPNLRRIYVVHNPKDAGSVAGLEDLHQIASHMGIEVVVTDVTTPEALYSALQDVPSDIDALFVLGSGFLSTYIDAFVAAAIEHKLPLASQCPCVEQGALLTYGAEFFEDGQQAARMAVRVLRGADPATMPVEHAEFFLSLNLRTAQEIGLDISESVLRSAHTIIR